MGEEALDLAGERELRLMGTPSGIEASEKEGRDERERAVRGEAEGEEAADAEAEAESVLVAVAVVLDLDDHTIALNRLKWG